MAGVPAIADRGDLATRTSGSIKTNPATIAWLHLAVAMQSNLNLRRSSHDAH